MHLRINIIRHYESHRRKQTDEPMVLPVYMAIEGVIPLFVCLFVWLVGWFTSLVPEGKSVFKQAGK